VARLRAGVTGSFARAGPGNCENSGLGQTSLDPLSSVSACRTPPMQRLSLNALCWTARQITTKS